MEYVYMEYVKTKPAKIYKFVLEILTLSRYKERHGNPKHVAEQTPYCLGMCGDVPSDPAPRENENGGYYGKATVGKNYTAGSVRVTYYDGIIKKNSYFFLW